MNFKHCLMLFLKYIQKCIKKSLSNNSTDFLMYIKLLRFNSKSYLTVTGIFMLSNPMDNSTKLIEKSYRTELNYIKASLLKIYMLYTKSWFIEYLFPNCRQLTHIILWSTQPLHVFYLSICHQACVIGWTNNIYWVFISTLNFLIITN